jgi:hypothetical protein
LVVVFAAMASGADRLISQSLVSQQESSLPAELLRLRADYERRLAEVRGPADDWYRMQLRGLLPRYEKTGDLELLALIRGELAHPDPSRAPETQKPLPPDLAGIRASYVLQAQRLSQPVEQWYRQQLQALRADLVRQGRLTDAAAVDGELAPSPKANPVGPSPAVAKEGWNQPSAWRTPKGGRLRVRDDEVVLSGPGNMVFEMALALCSVPDGAEYTIAGEICVSTAGGLLLAADPFLKAFVLISTSPLGTRVFEGRGNSVRLMAVASPEHLASEWMPFEIERKGDKIRIRFGRARTTLKLPDDVRGTAWGLATASQNQVAIRRVTISTSGQASSRSGPGELMR